MGHYIADNTYETSTSCQKEQVGGTNWCNTIGNRHPYIDVDKYFYPNLSSDYFKWIPKGLFQDLRDNRNDLLAVPQRVAINDQVNGFTNQQMFNALQWDITTLAQYQVRFKQQNPNNQTALITNLFGQYNY